MKRFSLEIIKDKKQNIQGEKTFIIKNEEKMENISIFLYKIGG